MAVENVKRFIKLINIGVPIPAIKVKMEAEGLDPNILDKYL